MARDLFSNRTYISAFINREYGVNFNRFINNYRLKEVERLRSEAVQKNKKYLRWRLLSMPDSVITAVISGLKPGKQRCRFYR